MMLSWSCLLVVSCLWYDGGKTGEQALGERAQLKGGVLTVAQWQGGPKHGSPTKRGVHQQPMGIAANVPSELMHSQVS